MTLFILIVGLYVGNAQAGQAVVSPDVTVICDHVDPIHGPVKVYVFSYYRDGGYSRVNVVRNSDDRSVYLRDSNDTLRESGTGSIRFWSPTANAWYTYSINRSQYGGRINYVNVGGQYNFTMRCN